MLTEQNHLVDHSIEKRCSATFEVSTVGLVPISASRAIKKRTRRNMDSGVEFFNDFNAIKVEQRARPPLCQAA